MNGGDYILMGMICIACLWGGAFLGQKTVEHNIYKTIELCEANLPRNQTCELVAIKKGLLDET